MQKAEASLLQLPGLHKFHATLKSDREKEDFRRHMRKYISIWLPDCPFEVSTTNRYTIVTHEAAVIARRGIKKGETVKYLVGNLVAMTPEEEKDLDLTRRDFSIVTSVRNKKTSLFLGPARFANHDCKANARLITRGSEGMQIVADRDIDVDEEITVTYGDNYFGEGNCECLCSSCEKSGRGAWSGSLTSSVDASLLDDEDENPPTRSLRSSTRKRSRTSEPSNSLSPQPDVSKRPRTRVTRKASALVAEPLDMISKRILRTNKKRVQPDEESSMHDAETDQNIARKRMKTEDVQPRRSSRNRNREGKVPGSLKVMGYQTPESSFVSATKTKSKISIAKTTPPVSPVADTILHNLKAALKKKPSKAGQNTLRGSPDSNDNPERITGEVPVLELVAPPSINSAPGSLLAAEKPTETPISCSDRDSLFDNPQVSSPATTLQPSEEPEGKTNLTSQTHWNSSESELSELDLNAELDDASMTVTEKAQKPKRGPRGAKILPTIEVEDASLRIPGDYTRTALLLGEKYSRWVDCRTCSGCWVQPNGYQTRKECPRCERHSKLYGFQWPKTDKIGRDDEEERVMDHRTVHRFIPPSEERLLVKKGKGCVRAGSESTSRTTSVIEIQKGPVSRLRESARGRRGS